MRMEMRTHHFDRDSCLLAILSRKGPAEVAAVAPEGLAALAEPVEGAAAPVGPGEPAAREERAAAPAVPMVEEREGELVAQTVVQLPVHR